MDRMIGSVPLMRRSCVGRSSAEA
ncbi:uncharacterized protein METZ01_LOCUS500224, partial [marine metagenome]